MDAALVLFVAAPLVLAVAVFVLLVAQDARKNPAWPTIGSRAPIPPPEPRLMPPPAPPRAP